MFLVAKDTTFLLSDVYSSWSVMHWLCVSHVQAILQVVDKIPTIATQLKIIATVKATRQGGDGE